MVWRNGYIPESDLVIFQRGRNNVDGDWYWGLTPGTYAKHLALVARAKARTGRTLSPSDGWGTYRPYAGQVIARRIYGNGAAIPGTSSHGGFWEGRETLAIDYGNWGYVYNWDRAAFYEDCRAVGLTPGMISKERGYPDEPWHVIDLDPRAAAPANAGNATPIVEDDMYNDSDRKRDDKMAQEVHAIWQSIFEGGTSMPDGMRSIGVSLDNLTKFADRIDRNTQPVRDAVFDGGTSMPDGNVSIGQSLADIAKAVGVKRDTP